MNVKKLSEIIDNHLLLIIITIAICAGLYIGAISWHDIKIWIVELIHDAKACK